MDSDLIQSFVVEATQRKTQHAEALRNSLRQRK